MTSDLRWGPYAARVSDVGAAIVSLTHDGRPLLLRTPDPVPTPPYAGVVLAPWPNRIAGGRYTFAGSAQQLPLNEVDRGNALHGLVLWDGWRRREQTAASVTLDHTLFPRPGYPHTLGLTAAYRLGPDGLSLTLTATNLGPTDAPVGLSVHPYLTTGDDHPLDRWTLELPCREVIETDERLLPRRAVPVDEVGLGFTPARTLGDVELDHAFTAPAYDAQGVAAARLVGPDGRGVQVGWGAACRWLQVYTLHAPGTPWHRRAVAVEPMTCPPDAFNSGEGLVVLGPGESTMMDCSLAAITGPPSAGRDQGMSERTASATMA